MRTCVYRLNMNGPADIQLLLIGPTGHGRSATGNSILGRNAFKTSSSPSSLTSEIECGLSELNSRRVKAVDSPGVGHTHMNKQNSVNLNATSMEYAIAANPHGYDAFLVVVRFGVKYTTEVNQTFDCLRKIFGQHFYNKYCILTVTCGDLFKKENLGSRKSIEEWLDEHPGDFTDLANECWRRVVLFDNMTTDATTRQEQVKQLLKIVDDLKSKGNRYTDDNFVKAREGRQRYIVEAQKVLIQEEIMKEANWILKGTEDTQSEDCLKTKAMQLQALHIHAHYLAKKVVSLDNSTGVLNAIIEYVEWLNKYVDAQRKFHVTTINETGVKNKEVKSTHLPKEDNIKQQTGDNDNKITTERIGSDELKTIQRRPEKQEILVGEESRKRADKGQTGNEIQSQAELYKQLLICQEAKKAESTMTSVGDMPEHKLDADLSTIKIGDSKQVDLLLIGKCAVGKSATGNSILGRQAFISKFDVTLVTRTVDYEVCEFNDRTITVVDTPGVFGFLKRNLLIQAMESAAALNPRGYNAFLLVIKYFSFEPEDHCMITKLKEIFGQDFVKNFCILVITFGDCFDNESKKTGISFEQWCYNRTGNLKCLIDECDNRVLLFDNRTDDFAKKNKQIENLLTTVDNLSSRGQRYTSENFERAKDSREQLKKGLFKKGTEAENVYLAFVGL